MTLKDLIDLAGDRELSKSYPKADGLYVWDYKLVDGDKLELIVSDSGKTGFKDKVSIDELVNYILKETDPQLPAEQIISQMKIVGAEGITIARI